MGNIRALAALFSMFILSLANDLVLNCHLFNLHIWNWLALIYRDCFTGNISFSKSLYSLSKNSRYAQYYCKFVWKCIHQFCTYCEHANSIVGIWSIISQWLYYHTIRIVYIYVLFIKWDAVTDDFPSCWSIDLSQSLIKMRIVFASTLLSGVLSTILTRILVKPLWNRGCSIFLVISCICWEYDMVHLFLFIDEYVCIWSWKGNVCIKANELPRTLVRYCTFYCFH